MKTEEKAKELFETARSWDPVDREVMVRIASRRFARPRRHRLRRMWTSMRQQMKRRWIPPLVFACALFAVWWLNGTAHAPNELAAPPARHHPRREVSKHVASPRPIPRGKRAPPSKVLVVEQPPPEAAPTSIVEPALTPLKESIAGEPMLRPYLPRAIAEFQEVDWKKFEAHDELPRYVQSIIERRDRPALLAALDRLELDAELRLMRGELRAGSARCLDAMSDFEAILGDGDLSALHQRAAYARDRCEGAR